MMFTMTKTMLQQHQITKIHSIIYIISHTVGILKFGSFSRGAMAMCAARVTHWNGANARAIEGQSDLT